MQITSSIRTGNFLPLSSCDIFYLMLDSCLRFHKKASRSTQACLDHRYKGFTVPTLHRCSSRSHLLSKRSANWHYRYLLVNWRCGRKGRG
jgi:hypothetical protein